MATAFGPGREWRPARLVLTLFMVLLVAAGGLQGLALAQVPPTVRPTAEAAIAAVDGLTDGQAKVLQQTLPCPHQAAGAAIPPNPVISNRFARPDGPIDIRSDSDLDGVQGLRNNVCFAPEGSGFTYEISFLRVSGTGPADPALPRGDVGGVINVESLVSPASSLWIHDVTIVDSQSTAPAPDVGLRVASAASDVQIDNVDLAGSDLVVEASDNVLIRGGTVGRDAIIRSSNVVIRDEVLLRDVIVQDALSIVIEDGVTLRSLSVTGTPDVTIMGVTLDPDGLPAGAPGASIIGGSNVNVMDLDLADRDLRLAGLTGDGNRLGPILNGLEATATSASATLVASSFRRLAASDGAFIRLDEVTLTGQPADAAPVLDIDGGSTVEVVGLPSVVNLAGPSSRTSVRVDGDGSLLRSSALVIGADHSSLTVPCISLTGGADLRLDGTANDLSRCTGRVVTAAYAGSVEIVDLGPESLTATPGLTATLFDLQVAESLLVQGGTFQGGKYAVRVAPPTGSSARPTVTTTVGPSGAALFKGQSTASLLIDAAVGATRVSGIQFDLTGAEPVMVAAVGTVPAPGRSSFTFANNHAMNNDGFSAPAGEEFEDLFEVFLNDELDAATCRPRVDALEASCGGNRWNSDVFTGYDSNGDGIAEQTYRPSSLRPTTIDALPLVDPNQAPYLDVYTFPDAQYSGTVIVPGMAIQFYTSVYDPEFDTVSGFRWNFGDGTTAAGSEASKTYSTAGEYTVTFSAQDSKGAPNTVSYPITVDARNRPPVGVDPTVKVCNDPAAQFFYNRQELCFSIDASDPDLGIHDRLDLIYLDRDGFGQRVVNEGDVRLGVAFEPSLPAGLAGTNDDDFGAPLGFDASSPPSSGLDAMPGDVASVAKRHPFTRGLYLDLDADGTVSRGDLRLSLDYWWGNVPGTRVRPTDLDAGGFLEPLDAPVRIAEDAAGNVFLQLSGAEEVSEGDLRLSGDAYGSFVSTEDFGQLGAVLTDVQGTLRVLDRDAFVRVTWNFKNGSADKTGEAVRQTYVVPKLYNVEANITDLGHPPASTEILVPTKVRPRFTPTADFIIDGQVCPSSGPCKIESRIPLLFVDNSTTHGLSPVIQRTWEFGDGTDATPSPDAPTVVKTYAGPRVEPFSVKYTITTEDLQTSTITKLYKVRSRDPEPSIEWSPEEDPTTLDDIEFSATGSTDLGHQLSSYSGPIRWADLNHDHAFGVDDLVALDPDVSGTYSSGDFRLSPLQTPLFNDPELGTPFFPEKLRDGYALDGVDDALVARGPLASNLRLTGDVNLYAAFHRDTKGAGDMNATPMGLLGTVGPFSYAGDANTPFGLRIEKDDRLTYWHESGPPQVRRHDFELETASPLIESSTGGDHHAIEYNGAAQALDVHGYSGYNCSTNYQSIDITPRADQFIERVSFLLDTERNLGFPGAVEPWNLYFGLVPTDGELIVDPSCEPGEYTGKLARFVGVKMEGDNVITDRDLRWRVDDAEDPGAMEYSVADDGLYKVEIVLRPFLTIRVLGGNGLNQVIYEYEAPEFDPTALYQSRFAIAWEGTNQAPSGDDVRVLAARLDDLMVTYVTEVVRTSTKTVGPGFHTLTFDRDAAAGTVLAKVDGQTFISASYLNPPTAGGLSAFALGRFFDAEGARHFDGAFYEVRLWDHRIGQSKLDSLAGPVGAARSPEGTEAALWYLDVDDHDKPGAGRTRDATLGSNPLDIEGASPAPAPGRNAFCYVDLDGSGDFSFGDGLFLSAPSCLSSSPGDVRIPAGNWILRRDSDLLPGQFIRPGDADVGPVRPLPANAQLARDIFGRIYLDTNGGTAPRRVEPGDVRLEGFDGRYAGSHVRAPSTGGDIGDRIVAYEWWCETGCEDPDAPDAESVRMWPPIGSGLPADGPVGPSPVQGRFTVGPSGADFRFLSSTIDKTIRVRLTDTHGDFVDTFVFVELANVAPVARISYAPGNPTDLDTVTFDASLSEDIDGLISDYSWDFGDGITDNGKIVRHRFEEPGLYIVNLTVTDEAAEGRQQTHTATHALFVRNLPPLVEFVNTPAEPQTKFPVQFDASSSTDGDGQIVSYLWDFGEPTSAENRAAGKFVSHSYEKKGLYNVNLTVADEDGGTSFVNRTIRVLNRPPNVFVQVDQPIQLPPATLSFTTAGTLDLDGSVVEYAWDFRDNSPIEKGPPASHASRNHTFTSRGVFNVAVTATDNDGGTSVGVVPVTILNQRPLVTLQVPAEVQANVSAAFRAFAFDPEGDALEYHWDFGDGANSTGTSTVEHSYARWGNYRVTVKVTDSGSAQATASETIRAISARPTAKLLANITKVKLGEPISFDGSGTDIDGTVVGHFIDLGDGTTVFSNKAVHAYKKPGKYTVLYRVTDDSQATGVATAAIDVENPPPLIKKVSVAPEGSAHVGDILLFSVEATDEDPSRLEFFWNFQDGKVSTLRTPQQVYMVPGTFIVELTVKDAFGARTTTTLPITVSGAGALTTTQAGPGPTQRQTESARPLEERPAAPERVDAPAAGLWATIILIAVAVLMVRRRGWS